MGAPAFVTGAALPKFHPVPRLSSAGDESRRAHSPKTQKREESLRRFFKTCHPYYYSKIPRNLEKIFFPCHSWRSLCGLRVFGVNSSPRSFTAQARSTRRKRE